MKIRVTCSDRDATDSSSDEDESGEGKKPSCKKRFLKEITVPIDSPTLIAAKTSVLEAANPHPTEWVGDKAIKDKKNETTSDFSDSIDKKEGGFGERKRVGVQRMKSGKWGAHIEHPTKRVKHRLGIFDTREEAASAYDGKRLEFETLMAATNVRDVGIAKQPGVRLTKSGKWSVQIVNPNKKGTKLYLGTFRTFKEAADAYNKKKMEFDSMAGSEKKGKTSRLSVIHEGSRDGLPSSVYQAEDSRVMMVNDCEKNEVNVNGRNPEMPNVSFPIGEGINSCIVKDAKGFDQDIFISNAMNGKGIEMAKQRGVRQRKSGKWTAAIRKPGKRNALHLGTFNTFEEAAEAYNEKRREFDLMGVSNKKQRESEISVLSNKLGNRSGCKPPTLAFGAQNQVVTAVNGRESEAGNASGESQKTPNSSLSEGLFVKISVPAATNGRDNGMARHPGVRQKKSGRWAAKIKRRGRNLHLGTFNTFEEAVNAYNQKRLEFDSTVSSTLWGKTSQVSVVSKISETGSVYTSPTSVLAAETCPGMVVNVYGSEGHGANGGNQQTPDFSYAVQRGLDLGVINSYGQLVGEYSRLDDELWFCKCENDEATTGCNAGFAWDP